METLINIENQETKKLDSELNKIFYDFKDSFDKLKQRATKTNQKKMFWIIRKALKNLEKDSWTSRVINWAFTDQDDDLFKKLSWYTKYNLKDRVESRISEIDWHLEDKRHYQQRFEQKNKNFIELQEKYNNLRNKNSIFYKLKNLFRKKENIQHIENIPF